MAGQKTPEQLEGIGSPSLDFGVGVGTICFGGAFLLGMLRGCAPQAIAPQKAPHNEPSC